MAAEYSEERKALALATLERNNMNFAKTAKEIGITKVTLAKWYNKDVKRDVEIKEIPIPDSLNAEMVKETLLKKIYQLAESTKDIEKAAKALNTICQLYPTTQDGDEKQNLYDYIEQVIAKQKQ